MAENPRVQQLLDEILESERSPEEVCGSCPELLPEVRRRWQEMCCVEAELKALFPSTDVVAGGGGRGGGGAGRGAGAGRGRSGAGRGGRPADAGGSGWRRAGPAVP